MTKEILEGDGGAPGEWKWRESRWLAGVGSALVIAANSYLTGASAPDEIPAMGAPQAEPRSGVLVYGIDAAIIGVTALGLWLKDMRRKMR